MSRFFETTPIAIVGMACRLPGAADLDAYWELLRQGRSAVAELPPTRFDRELYYDPNVGTIGKSYSTLGALTPESPIDPRQLGLSSAVVAAADPAYLTICNVAADALRHAGWDPFCLPNRNAGVYIGTAAGSPRAGCRVFASLVGHTATYLRELRSWHALREAGANAALGEEAIRETVAELRRRNSDATDGLEQNLGAHTAGGLIAQAFGLRGPYMAVEAACASSLQAVLLGAQALQQGRVEFAIVGGASCFRGDKMVLFSKAQTLSATGTRPFDDTADGLVVAEGYVAMVLKTLPRALQDGDRICAVIRGAGMSTDGRGKSLWAPRHEGQIVAIRRAYSHGVDLGRVQYIEAHATSTQVGDATELTALIESASGKLPAGHRIALGSAKSNFGHALEAAGIVGLTKTVLGLQHRQIPPSINITRLNSTVAWDQIPFYVARELQSWPENQGQPRRAGVNAFGVGGLNVHMVVDEFVPERPSSFYFSKPGPAAAPDEPIAVIGLGTILPGARTIEQFWDLLCSGADPKGEVPADRWNKGEHCEPGAAVAWKIPSCLGGFIRDYQYDWRAKKIPPRQVEQANPLQFMLLDAAEQALKHAGYDQRPFDRTKMGVVVGSVFAGDFQDQMQMGLRVPEFNATLGCVLRGKGVPESAIAAITAEYRECFLQHMPALLDETGSFTSSTLASRITKTFDLMGGAFAVDAGGGSALAALACALDVLRSGECDMILCAAGQRCMDPFAFASMARSGVLAAGLPRSSFDRHGDGAVPGEGVGIILLRRLSDAERAGEPIRAVIRDVGGRADFQAPQTTPGEALRQALQRANSAPAKLAALELSSPTPAAASAELASVAGVLAESSLPQPVQLGSATTQFGYSGAANPMTSLAKVVLGFGHGLRSLATNVADPLPVISDQSQLFALPKSSTHLTPGDTNQNLTAVLSATSGSQTFAALLEPAPNTSPQQALEIPCAQPRPRIAWMFAGQGSQYQGMLRQLVSEFAPAAAAMERIDQVFAPHGCGTFAELAWENSTGLGTDPWPTQLAMLAADYIAAASLEALGVAPAVVAGHSFGELPAMLTAGVWSLETVVKCIRARSDALAWVGPDPGGMVAVTASRDLVEQITVEAAQTGTVFIANHNAPSQYVLSGELAALSRVLELAKQANVNAVRLVVPCAYHSPLMSPAVPVFAAMLPQFEMRDARIPVLSTILNRYLVSAEDLRAGLLEHFTRPVPYVEMVRKLAADHPTVFVEIGPQRVLTKLNQKVLGNENCLAVATDDAKQPGLAQLKNVVAALQNAGALISGGTPVALQSPRTGRLIHFDATESRRQHRRQRAADSGATTPPRSPSPTASDAANRAEPRPTPGNSELHRFMVQFIVEQTGYPEEMVDLDADLEADLGIDSIKKAQLFGEIREHFKVDPPSGGVTLDDFPTLRHVLDFLANAGANPAASNGQSNPPGAGQGEARPEAKSAAGRMLRFVPRLVPEPLGSSPSPSRLGQRALVIGRNPDATKLRAQLKRHGVEVVSLPYSLDPKRVAATLQQAWIGGPIPHLFLLTPRDATPMPWSDQAAWKQRRQRGVLYPFVVSQKWFELLATSESDAQATLLVATSLGGDLGFTGRFESPESGALAGLVKAIGAESAGRVWTKVLDFPQPFDSTRLAALLLAEVTALSPGAEAAFDPGGQRRAVRMSPMPATSLPQREIKPGATWVVTGGGRGVTAFVARELGRQFGLKLHILGSRPRIAVDPKWLEFGPDELKELKAKHAREARAKGESPAAGWERLERGLELERNLRSNADLGIPTVYHQCDVADRAKVAEILAGIQTADGPIEGVIHGAGVEHACKFSAKLLASVDRTIAAKVDGAAALMAALEAHPPRHFIAFGSVSGRFGGIGQTDYSLANDMLAKLTAQFRRRHPECAAVCLDWTAWDEVGMAARPESKFALEAMKVRFLPPREGTAHLIGELQSQGEDAEVLISDQAESHAPKLEATPANLKPVLTPAPTPGAAPVNGSELSAREFGRKHRGEIQSWLREFADRATDSGIPSGLSPMPAGMLRICAAPTEPELQELAIGAGVSVISLRPHLQRQRGIAADLDFAGKFPLIETAHLVAPGGKLAAQAILRPQADVFLVEHRIYNRPVLPGAVSMELLAEAASLLYPGQHLASLTELELLVRCEFNGETTARLDLEIEGVAGGADCRLLRTRDGAKPGKPITIARSRANFTKSRGAPPTLTFEAPPMDWRPYTYRDDWAVMYHGPNFRTLQAVALGPDGGQARLQANGPLALAAGRPGSDWLVPSALLDGCLYACGSYSFLSKNQRVEVPRRLDEIRLFRQPAAGENCRMQFQLRSFTAQGSSYDFQLAGADGAAILTVTGYHSVCIKAGKVQP